MEHGKLQNILNKYKDLNKLKEDLEIKINSINMNIESIEKQNEDYNKKIRKIKEAKKNLKVYNTMFLIILIIASIIIFHNFSLINLMSVLGVTAIYFGVTSNDRKTIIGDNIKNINKKYYENINSLSLLKEQEKQLKRELKTCKTNRKSSEQFLEGIILEASKVLSDETINEIVNGTVNEIPVIPEVVMDQVANNGNQKKLNKTMN